MSTPAGERRQFDRRSVLEILEQLADGVIVVDRAGIIRFANNAALSMFGRAEEELLGEEFGFAVAPGRTTEIDVLPRGRPPVTAELRVVDTTWDGEPVTLVSLRDISDRKAAEERARELATARAAQAEAEAENRAKSEFLATMSHELRTPLNAVLGYAQLLDIGVGGTLNDGQRSQINRIVASGRHLLGLVDEVLDIARVEAGRLSIHRAVHDARSAAETALMLVEALTEGTGVTLAPLPVELRDIQYVGDEDRVRQVLVNLLTNAVKFTPSGGRVWMTAEQRDATPHSVRAHGPGPWTALHVHDTGIGVPPTQLDEIFLAFTQVDSGHTRRRDGTGLGLTVSRRLARLMDGDVTVESTPGVGSVFSLWLPAPVTPSATAGDTSDGEAWLERPAVDGLGDVGEMLLRETSEIVENVVTRLRAAPEIPAARQLRFSQLSDHLPTLIADWAGSLIALEEAQGLPSPIVTDGIDLQRLLGERHGAQRAHLGWSRSALEREAAIVSEEIEAAVARLYRDPADVRRINALGVLQRMQLHAESASEQALARLTADGEAGPGVTNAQDTAQDAAP